MAMHLDHFSISSPNLYYGAHRLRLESTLSFYDGGYFLNGDHANRIFPLGANTYLELNGIVNAESVVIPKNRPWWYEKVQTVGECFTGLGGLPNWYWFEDLPMHPSGQPPVSWPNITRPDGIAWIEVGGTEKEMYDWLDVPAGTFPFKFNGKLPGLYAIGVKTMKGGEVVIRRPSATEY